MHHGTHRNSIGHSIFAVFQPHWERIFRFAFYQEEASYLCSPERAISMCHCSKVRKILDL